MQKLSTGKNQHRAQGRNGVVASTVAANATLSDDQLIEKIVRRVGTPCYLYFEGRIRENLSRFKDIPYPHAAVHFATMANDNPRLLEMIREAGYGAFVNSPKHLELVRNCGFGSREVIFASTGTPPALLKKLARMGVQVNLDSIQQVARYGIICPGGRIGVRLNIDEKSKNNVFIGAQSRIGLLESEFSELLKVAADSNLHLIGTHVYLGTDVSRIDDILAGVEKTLALSDHFPELEFVDLGGGFPIDRSRFDLDTYKAEVTQLLERYSVHRGRPIKLVIEPGRSMFGDAAVFCATVTDVKHRPDRVLVGCDASASLLPRAMFYEDYNPVRIASSEGCAGFELPVDIVGATTYSRDFLVRKADLPVSHPGDLLIFGNAGSYCYSMITRFLGQTMPPEYLIKVDGQLELIREGESFLDTESA